MNGRSTALWREQNQTCASSGGLREDPSSRTLKPQAKGVGVNETDHRIRLLVICKPTVSDLGANETDHQIRLPVISTPVLSDVGVNETDQCEE